MQKLTLDLDEIRVESFETEEAGDVRGTVHAHDDTQETEWCTPRVGTCYPKLTCPWCPPDQ
jgi:hypothetical protein